jgi:ribosomal protein S16
MIKKNNLVKRIKLSFFTYRIRLHRTGRHKRPVYKIVVVNFNNRIISQIGYYIPHLNSELIGKKKRDYVSFYIRKKIIFLDRNACISWLRKSVKLSPFIFYVFLSLGLIKINYNEELYTELIP